MMQKLIKALFSNVAILTALYTCKLVIRIYVGYTRFFILPTPLGVCAAGRFIQTCNTPTKCCWLLEIQASQF